jgi:Domain of unknown function (DUF3859)
MNTRTVFMILLVAHGAIGCGRQPASKPTVRLIEYGIIRPVGPFTQHADPKTAAGFTSSGPGHSVFEQRTTEVPAVQGIAFGIRYRIEGIAPGQAVVVEEIIHYPPMTKPDGTVATEEQTKNTFVPKDGYIDQKFFYRLGQPYEVVSGDWSLAVAVNGSIAIDQHFTVQAGK